MMLTLEDIFYVSCLKVSFCEPAEAQTPAAETGRPTRAESAAESEGSEPPLNEDDDDEPDENDQGDEEPTTEHFVLAQFDKVRKH